MAALPGCIISDTLSALGPSGAMQPHAGVIRAQASLTPLFVQQSDGSFIEHANVVIQDVDVAASGTWTLVLPSQANCDPPTVVWTITLPDGTAWAGSVSDAMVAASQSAALRLHDLKQTYGWTATPRALTTPLLGIAGGIATLDSNSHVVQQAVYDSTEAATNDALGPTSTITNNLNRIRYQIGRLVGGAWTAAVQMIPLSQKAAASGVCDLDSATKVPLARLPVATAAAVGAVKPGANLSVDGAGTLAGQPGTVTSVDVTTSSGLHSVSGSPVTGAGSISLTLNTQNPNQVFAGPAAGSAAQPTMRALVPADLPAATASAIGGVRRSVFNVLDYGAKGDGRVITDGAMTLGQAALTSASAAFVSADVGKQLCVVGAGAAGANYTGTITAIVSTSSVTLNAAAQTTVSGAFATIGSDDTAAIQAAMDACAAAGGGTVYRPVSPSGGRYLLNSYSHTAYDGYYNLALRGSHMTLASAREAAILQQGPGGVHATGTSTKMLVLNNGSIDGILAGLPSYPYQAALRGDLVLTTTTASDAGHFSVGDIIVIISTPPSFSGRYLELNVVTSSNAQTGALGLQYALGKDYPQDAPYGVAVATGTVLTDIEFSRECWHSLDFWTDGGGIFGLRWTDSTWDRGTALDTTGGCIETSIIRRWTIAGCDFSFDNYWTELDSGMSDVTIENCTFTQRSTVAGAATAIFCDEGAGTIHILNNYLWSAGSTNPADALVSVVNAQEVVIAGNYINVNANVGGHFMYAIMAVPAPVTGATTLDLQIRDNIIAGAVYCDAPGAVVAGNTFYYTGWGQALHATGNFAQRTLISANVLYLGAANALGIYLEGGPLNYLVVGNMVHGNNAGGQKAIAVNDPGAVQAQSPTLVGNYADGCAQGLSLASQAHVPDTLCVGNDFSGCATPYSPTDPLGGAQSISVGASPFTYTANAKTAEMVYVSGGAVSSVAKDGVAVFGATPCAVRLNPGAALTVTYSTLPAMARERVS